MLNRSRVVIGGLPPGVELITDGSRREGEERGLQYLHEYEYGHRSQKRRLDREVQRVYQVVVYSFIIVLKKKVASLLYFTLPVLMGVRPVQRTNRQSKGRSRPICYLPNIIRIVQRSRTL